MKQIWLQKGHVTFQGQGHVISRTLLLILVAYVRMHLCVKFDANRTIRLRVIQMVPQRDRVTATLRSLQYRQNDFFKDKSFSNTFCGKNGKIVNIILQN